jgi:hypothetical protein
VLRHLRVQGWISTWCKVLASQQIWFWARGAPAAAILSAT